MSDLPTDMSPLARRLVVGEAAALARSITAVENETQEGAAILASVQQHLGRALVLGITGPPGAGKSTLTGALITELRGRGRRVAVLAVDPTSPISGGAILGDRIRMSEHSADPGVFVRSVASRGHLGGLSPTATRVIDLMDAGGNDTVIVETVGAGQSEVEVAQIADVNVVICAPGAGDDIQAIKAGILEVADILVVNKADQPLAANAASQMRNMVALRDGDASDVPVLLTVATQGDGVPELLDTIEARRAGDDPEARGVRIRARTRRQLAEAVARDVAGFVGAGSDPAIEKLCTEFQLGRLSLDEAVRRARALI
ncbi:MAG: methylmalonyl Co-A mutase-associated GTPase MeaB [Actinomycetia bacterium]|nr:methylmalonyl Co-A mutase-associated GTPase MeaB [Actinomycetes bacterium]